MALLGGFAGPALLVYGLESTDAVRASLLLTLEAPLTALLAAALFREYVSRRVWLAVTSSPSEQPRWRIRRSPTAPAETR